MTGRPAIVCGRPAGFPGGGWPAHHIPWPTGPPYTMHHIVCHDILLCILLCILVGISLGILLHISLGILLDLLNILLTAYYLPIDSSLLANYRRQVVWVTAWTLWKRVHVLLAIAMDGMARNVSSQITWGGLDRPVSPPSVIDLTNNNINPIMVQ